MNQVGRSGPVQLKRTVTPVARIISSAPIPVKIHLFFIKAQVLQFFYILRLHVGLVHVKTYSTIQIYIQSLNIFVCDKLTWETTEHSYRDYQPETRHSLTSDNRKLSCESTPAKLCLQAFFYVRLASQLHCGLRL